MTPEELAALLQQEEAAIAQLEAMPDVVPPPSYLDRAKVGASMMPTPFRQLAEMGISAVEYPRTIFEEGASIGGSIVGGGAGAVLGAPLAPFTGGLSIPAGSIIGSALGSYADVPVQMGLDYLTGATPEQSRLDQATNEAILGAGIETALRGAGTAGRVALPLVRRAAGALDNFFGPATAEQAQRLVGTELAKSITPKEVAEAAAQKEVLVRAGLPAEALTTADITGSPQLARTEALLSRQPLGDANIAFAETAQKQLDDINRSAESLTELRDPNPKRAGEAAKKMLESAREKQRASAGSLFTDEVRQIAAPVEGIAKSADDVYKSVYNDTKVLEPTGEMKSLLAKIKELEKAPAAEKAPAGFGRETKEAAKKPTITTVGKLQDLRSEALELSRSATKGSRDELFADRLVELLGRQIDEIPGTEALSQARNEWRQYKQRWFRNAEGQPSPLYTLLRKQNPEDIISSVGKKSAVSDEYAKVLGGLEPNKLATEMADFVQQGTIDQKINWIRSKRAVYADSPIMPILQQWDDILKRIKEKGEAAAIPGLSVENIDVQAKSLVRALGGTGAAATASGAEAGAFSAAGNVARSAATGALGGSTVGTIAGFGLPVVTGKIQASTARTAQALTEALSDPATAYKYMADAAKYGKEEAAARALQNQKVNQLASALTGIAPKAAALGRSAGLFTPDVTYQSAASEPESLDAIAAEEAQLQALIDAEKAKAETPTPTPTPEPTKAPEQVAVKVGKQNVNIPVGDGYAPARLVKAVMRVESGGDPNAVSYKGARGLMQLMPATARDLGVDANDPQENVEGGSRYLAQQLKEFGDPELALAAYNWGPRRVQNAIAKLEAEGKKPTWDNVKSIVKVPRETREYVDRVLSFI
jgi:soluble lytic murein transglycosylase-like protein